MEPAGRPTRAHGGRLTAGERQHLRPSQFARPGKGEGKGGKGSGSYPIPDRAHAKSALGLVNMHHPGTAEAATVERKVHAKYPDLGKD